MNYVLSLGREIIEKRKLIWDLGKADFRKRFVGSYFGIVSVSYTHLDVYKRQPVCRPFCAGCGPDMQDLEGMRYRAGQMTARY